MQNFERIVASLLLLSVSMTQEKKYNHSVSERFYADCSEDTSERFYADCNEDTCPTPAAREGSLTSKRYFVEKNK